MANGIKRNVESGILKLAYLLNFILPKDSRKIFFYSSPDYSDNARAVYEEMVRQGLDKKYSVVWAVKDLQKYKKVLPDVILVKHRTVRNLWHFCRSKFIFRTHSLWGNKYVYGRQKMCIAWHGMPLKKLVQPDGSVVKTTCDVLTSTAPFFDNELASSMGLDMSVCKHVGLPRNDALFNGGDDLAIRYPGFKKRIIWMPTFRNANGFENGVDSELGVPCVSKEELPLLNKALNELNYLLILKLHPWSAEKLNNINFSNIVNLKDSDIVGDASLYRLIGQTDALITDYSSIYIDYLLINKPICFACDDIDEYRKTRGFAYEPVENYMPGEIISDCKQLILWFENFELDDQFEKKRNELKKLFYVYPDDNSSKRLLDEMGIV